MLYGNRLPGKGNSEPQIHKAPERNFAREPGLTVDEVDRPGSGARKRRSDEEVVEAVAVQVSRGGEAPRLPGGAREESGPAAEDCILRCGQRGSLLARAIEEECIARVGPDEEVFDPIPVRVPSGSHRPTEEPPEVAALDDDP